MITLPAPQTTGGKPLMEALGERRSTRDWREIDIYAVAAEGTWRYDADAQVLTPFVAGDLRARTGHQDFVASAPLTLVYVADLDRMGDADAEQKRLYSATDTGFFAQNVYLYCASAQLAVVVRGSIDRDALARALKLAPNQHRRWAIRGDSRPADAVCPVG